jgi:hypothetical protein
MWITPDEDRAGSRPFLLRFRCPLDSPPVAITYDRTARVNMVAGQAVPAVKAGREVKTTGVEAED